jgi:hypothetical protein
MRAKTPHRASKTSAGILCLLLTMLAGLLSAAPAGAGTVTNDRPLLFSFDGSDTTAGAFTGPQNIAIDNSGDVYVLNVSGDEGKGPGPFDAQRVIDKFNPDGTAADFAALGKSSLDGSATGAAFGVLGYFENGALRTDLAVDTSAINPGRIYIGEDFGPVHAFAPDGAYLWTLSAGFKSCGVAIDPDGHPWVLDCSDNTNPQALEFAATGSPPAQIGSFPLRKGAAIATEHPAIDNSDDFYLASGAATVTDPLHCLQSPFSPAARRPEKYVGGVFDSFLIPSPSPGGCWDLNAAPPEDEVNEIAIDQNSPTGHIFTVHDEQFREFDSSDSLVPGNPFGDQEIGKGDGIAYNPAKDWVYVSDRATDTVKVFGPPTSGPVPDAASQPTTAITRSGATAHATINPQGPPNSYRFQWAPGAKQIQHLTVVANAGTFRIVAGGVNPGSTAALPFDISTTALREALEGLAAIGSGNVTVSGTPTPPGANVGEYDISFTGALDGVDVAELGAADIDLSGGGFGGSYPVIVPASRVPNWGAAESSPPLSIEPTDSSTHQLSYGLTGLTGNTTYSVRLVATNTGNHLTAYSTPADVFTTPPAPLPTVAIDSVSPITTTSAHLTGTVDPQEDTTTWQLYRSTDPSCNGGFTEVGSLQTISEPPPGPVAVSGDFTGLLPAQTYCLRLVATNSGGTRTADQVIQTAVIAPTDLETAFAAPRTDTSTRINGRIDPQGEADLTYHFEISSDATHWNPRPDLLSTAAARVPIVIADQLTGLEPDTTYYYRLAAASNSAGPAPGPPGETRSFKTRPSPAPRQCPNQDVRAAQHTAYLPDCRGIELVNNPDKGNQSAFGAINLYFVDEPVSSDGDKTFWMVTGGAPGAPGGTESAFLATRTPTGWGSAAAAPPVDQQIGGGDLAYQLSWVAPDLGTYLFNAKRSTAAAAPSPPAWVRIHSGQSPELLKTYELPLNNPAYQQELQVSDDGAHVVFPDNKTRQLEDIGTGAPQTLSIMPSGTPSACGLDIGTGAEFGNGALLQPGYAQIAITDASRVYFQVPADGKCSGPRGLYVRNRAGKGKTTLIDPGTAGTSSFIRATPDGKSAYFLSRDSLDPADANAGTDLYRWDEASAKSSCLTCLVADADLAAALVSDDFSHVYFLSPHALAPGATPGAGIDDQNLYVLSGGHLRYIGHVDGNALKNDSGGAPGLTGDGNVLLFPAVASLRLTADPPSSACAAGCHELYRYDDRDASLECVSCLHGGLTAEPVGGRWRLSGDGSTAAFVTTMPLLGADVNRETDVYEWRDGAIGLLSDGISDFASGASEMKPWGIDYDGSDVFFGLARPGGITGFERDGLLNIYDARIDGGFTPPTPDVHCSEDSCQGPLQSAPPLRSPGSATIEGPGNPKPALRCPKGKPHRHGRCAKKHHKPKGDQKHAHRRSAGETGRTHR